MEKKYRYQRFFFILLCFFFRSIAMRGSEYDGKSFQEDDLERVDKNAASFEGKKMGYPVKIFLGVGMALALWVLFQKKNSGKKKKKKKISSRPKLNLKNQKGKKNIAESFEFYPEDDLFPLKSQRPNVAQIIKEKKEIKKGKKLILTSFTQYSHPAIMHKEYSISDTCTVKDDDCIYQEAETFDAKMKGDLRQFYNAKYSTIKNKQKVRLLFLNKVTQAGGKIPTLYLYAAGRWEDAITEKNFVEKNRYIIDAKNCTIREKQDPENNLPEGRKIILRTSVDQSGFFSNSDFVFEIGEQGKISKIAYCYHARGNGVCTCASLAFLLEFEENPNINLLSVDLYKCGEKAIKLYKKHCRDDFLFGQASAPVNILKGVGWPLRADIQEDISWLIHKPSVYEPKAMDHNHFIPTKNAFEALFKREENQKKQNLALMKVGAETMALVARYNNDTFEFYLYDSHGKNAIAQENNGQPGTFVKKFESVKDLSKFVYGNKGENQANDQIQNQQLTEVAFFWLSEKKLGKGPLPISKNSA